MFNNLLKFVLGPREEKLCQTLNHIIDITNNNVLYGIALDLNLGWSGEYIGYSKFKKYFTFKIYKTSVVDGKTIIDEKQYTINTHSGNIVNSQIQQIIK